MRLHSGCWPGYTESGAGDRIPPLPCERQSCLSSSPTAYSRSPSIGRRSSSTPALRLSESLEPPRELAAGAESEASHYGGREKFDPGGARASGEPGPTKKF